MPACRTPAKKSTTNRLTLLAEAARSDSDARDALLSELAGLLPRAVSRELGRRGCALSDEDIADVVQDILVEVWLKDLPRFDSALGTFLTFLKRRIAWRVMDAVRGRARCAEDSLEESAEHGFDPEAVGARPDELCESSAFELKLLVFEHAVADALEGDDRAHVAVVEHDLRGRPLREVADTLGVHTSNACRARQRGLARLKAALPARGYAAAAA
jgi:RNA polymerase sigma factor (sigma-70 family)